MTCVLGMVVIREREIRNFVETPFYRVVGNFFDAEIEGEWKAVEGSSYYASPLLYKENGFKEKVHAEKLIKDLTNKTAIVKTVDKGISKKRAPLLFNLAELQAECSKRFKISPDETLQVAQDLYERKLTTYPRTDARVLSSAVAKEISKNIRGLRSFDPVAPFAQNIMEHGLYKNIGKSSYTDDSKIQYWLDYTTVNLNLKQVRVKKAYSVLGSITVIGNASEYNKMALIANGRNPSLSLIHI